MKSRLAGSTKYGEVYGGGSTTTPLIFFIYPTVLPLFQGENNSINVISHGDHMHHAWFSSFLLFSLYLL